MKISLRANKQVSIPEVGKEYLFFDDGKTSPSRIFKAKVLRVIPSNEEIIVEKYNSDIQWLVPTPIQKVHKAEASHCDWLFAEETDYFIECSIPKYDDNPIWFARTKDGGWFSMDIQSFWQGGRLDVDGLITETNFGTPINELEL
ncbi:MAG: hypothetical protein J1F35_08385 [Erysipelotrichales bacterium]|nr:hypothetical protein [Erysipelotrichales bacterium]